MKCGEEVLEEGSRGSEWQGTRPGTIQAGAHLPPIRRRYAKSIKFPGCFDAAMRVKHARCALLLLHVLPSIVWFRLH